MMQISKEEKHKGKKYKTTSQISERKNGRDNTRKIHFRTLHKVMKNVVIFAIIFYSQPHLVIYFVYNFLLETC